MYLKKMYVSVTYFHKFPYSDRFLLKSVIFTCIFILYINCEVVTWHTMQTKKNEEIIHSNLDNFCYTMLHVPKQNGLAIASYSKPDLKVRIYDILDA